MTRRKETDEEPDAVDFARTLAFMLSRHHRLEMEGNDERLRQAVIVKTLALVSLAFGIPAEDGQPLDEEECLGKLVTAMRMLRGAMQ